MAKEIHICKDTPLHCLLAYADRVETEEGNIYYKLPIWFKKEGSWFSVYGEDVPEDLSMFITKAGLGKLNPQIIKARI